ncbi:MAG TPA: GumC family protein, partial [Phormidium sp.]
MESRESIDLDFSRYLLTIKRRWLPAVTIFAITVTSAVFATRFLKQSYQAEGKLLFKVDRTSVLTGVGGGTEELGPLVSTQNPLSTEIEVVYSKPLLQNTIDAIGLKNKKNQPLTPEDIKRKLTVKIIGGTDVLRIAYESSTAEEAATVVNKVMSLYIQKNILTNRAEAAAAREFIAQQLPKTEAAVRKVEASLREFKEKNNVVSLPEEAKTAVAAIAALDSQITTLRAQLQETVARSAALGNTVGLSAQEAIAVSALSQSPAVQGVLKELQAVETQLANQRSIYREESPTIASLKDKETILKVLLQQQIQQVVGSQIQIPERLLQIGDLKQNLIKDFLAAEVQRLSLAKQLASLSSSQTAYQKRVNILPKLEQDQRDLERKLEAAQSTYATLLKKMQEAQVAENQNTGNARIIEEATVPEKPESGSKAKIIALGVLLGALFSTTTILLLEISDKSIKTL